MTEVTPVKKLFLILAGLILGLIIYAVYFVGGFFTLAGFLVERATQPVSLSVPAEKALENRQEISLENSLLQFIGRIKLGGLTGIDQDALNVLAEQGLAALPDQPGYALTGIEIALSPATIKLNLDLAGRTRIPLTSAAALRPVATSLKIQIHAVPGEKGMLLSLKKLKLNKLPLPLSLVERYLTPETISSFGLPLVPVEPLTVSLPYTWFDAMLPGGIEVAGLEIRQGMLAARLNVDSRLKTDILNELSPFFHQYGTSLYEAVEAAFPDPDSSQRELLRTASELARMYSSPDLFPDQPSALVSLRENEVWAEPPGKSPFMPEVGSDLFAGTIVRTEEESSLEMILRDGSLLKVGQKSRFKLDVLPENSENHLARFTLEDGIIRGQVARTEATDFAFATPHAVTEVRGTDLVIETDRGKKLSVKVLVGSVAVIPASQQESLLRGAEKLQASRREQESRKDLLLPVEAFSGDEATVIENEIPILTRPEAAEEIRSNTLFWSTADGLTKMVTHIMIMEEEQREILGQELEKRIPPEAIDRSFSRLMENPDIAETVHGLAIEGIPYP